MKRALAGSVALVVTAGASAWLGATLAAPERPPAEPSSPHSEATPARDDRELLASLAIEIGELRREVERERVERVALSAEVQRLAKQPRPGLRDDGETGESGAEGHRAAPPDLALLSPEERAEREREILVAAGFDERAVADYRERMDAIELERLYLRDRAGREDWRRSERYREEMSELDARARELGAEVGEDFVDWTLYARGEANRLAVDHVMAGSAAAEAGLRPGDLVVRYDEAALRNPWELARQTRSGRAEEPVDVVVERNGERFTVTVPRGPLGVRTEGRSVEP